MKNNIQIFNDRLDSDKEFYRAFKELTSIHSPKSSEWYDSIVDFAKTNGYIFSRVELISHFNDENNPEIMSEVLADRLRELEILNKKSEYYFNEKIDELNIEIGSIKKTNNQLETSNADKDKIISDLQRQVQSLSNSIKTKTNETQKYISELNTLKQSLESGKNKGSCLLALSLLITISAAVSIFWANNFLNELSGIKSENERNKNYRYECENQVRELTRTVKTYETALNNQQYTIINLQNEISYLNSMKAVNYEEPEDYEE